jgi:hypothetical protein
VFFSTSFLQASLIFTSKAGAYPSGLLDLLTNSRQACQGQTKRSMLLRAFINYDCKKSFNIDTALKRKKCFICLKWLEFDQGDQIGQNLTKTWLGNFLGYFSLSLGDFLTKTSGHPEFDDKNNRDTFSRSNKNFWFSF